MTKNLDLVNVVASGSLGIEIDLVAITEELGPSATYDPEKYSGGYIRLSEDGPLITIYRTGKYIITGAQSENEIRQTRDTFLSLLTDRGVIAESVDEWFRIQNYVLVAELDRPIDLATASFALGLEATEYEPEQFPGLVYRPSSHDCVLLIFTSGKVVITGALSVDSGRAAVQHLEEYLDDVL